ncbi:MAG: hypothetical protein JWN44_5946 [Myxococcales bacterium]|nr:hypothetical protein [Myxococcales bacterium]
MPTVRSQRHSAPRRLQVVLAALVPFMGVEAGARATSRMQLSVQGVLGDAVNLGPPYQARPTILVFMSRRAKDESSAFARALDETLLNAPVESVGVVDVRRYAGLLRRVATSYLKKSASEALDHRRERRVAMGIDASAEVVNRWHLIGDFDGALFERFSVEREPARPLAFLVDRDGGVHGPFADVTSVVSAYSTSSPPPR